MQRTRELLKQYPPEIHTGVELVSTVGGNQSNADIQYYIQGPDLDKLAQVLRRSCWRKMKTIPGLADTDTTLRSGKPEVRLEIDRAARRRPGRFASMDIEQALNTLVAGQVASTFNAGDDQYDVRVRAAGAVPRQRRRAWRSMTVPSAKVGSVGLDEVVRIAPGTGPSSINRINRQRQVTLIGQRAGGRIAGGRAGQAEPVHRTDWAWSPDYRAGAHRHVEGTGPHRLLLRAGVLADVHLHVHRAGGAVRILHPPDHDSDHACRWRCRSASCRC